MSAVPIDATVPSLAEQMPTYVQLLAKVDHLMDALDDARQDKERALYELHIMRGNGVIDLGKLERAIKGEHR
jgi:hypothetical protein